MVLREEVTNKIASNILQGGDPNVILNMLEKAIKEEFIKQIELRVEQLNYIDEIYEEEFINELNNIAFK